LNEENNLLMVKIELYQDAIRKCQTLLHFENGGMEFSRNEITLSSSTLLGEDQDAFGFNAPNEYSEPIVQDGDKKTKRKRVS
jgi:hypothetical protein